MLLDSTLSIDTILHLGELVALLGTLFGAYFKLNTKVDVLKTELNNNKENTKEANIKLEFRLNSSETKLDEKITHLEEKIDRLPHDIIELFKQLK